MATATGTDPNGNPTDDMDNHDETLPQNPAITVEKSSTTTELTAPGTVTYNYLVNNTGNVAITGLSLNDDNDNDDLVCDATTIPVGGSTNCTATRTFTQAELDAGGTLDNIVTATSNAPTVTDDLSIPIVQNPALDINKVTVSGAQSGDNLSGVIAGTSITWRYTVKNIGNMTLSGITVKDDAGTAATGDDFSATYVSGDTNMNNKLDVGETWIFEKTGTAVAGSYSNIGTADSNESDPDTDPSSYFGTADLGQIAPTGVTCGQYVNGTASDFSTFYASQGGVVQYQVKANKISATNPGVFFYYTGLSQTITGAGPVFIDQSDDNANIGPFAPVPNDVKLWLVTGTTCTQVQLSASQITITDGDVTVDIAAAAPVGSYYVISVKYDTGSVKTQSAVGKPTVKFTFTTDVGNNGSIEETDTKGITLVSKK